MAQSAYSPVPSVEPSLTVPNDYQHQQASPNDFGAQVGAAEQNLGQSTEQVALQYTSIASTQKANDFLDFAQKRLYGDPNDPNNPGAMNMRGADAMSAIASATQDIQQKRKEITTGLSPIGQQEFERATFNMDRSMIASAASHARAAQNEWADGQATVQQQNGLRGIADGAERGDLDLVNASRQSVISGTVGRMQAKYGTLSPEMMQSAVDQGKGLAAESHVRALIPTNPARAAAVLETEKPFLTGQQYEVLSNQLKTKATLDDGSNLANYALGLGPKPTPLSADKPTRAGGGEAASGGLSADAHYNYLTSIGASPNEAALLTSAAASESSFRPDIPHDGGIGYGLYGHNGARLAAMRQDAGTDTPGWQAQAKFALGELRSRPEGAAVNSAQTPEALTDLQMQFEQPNRNINNGNYAGRLAATREYMQSPPVSGATPTPDALVGQPSQPPQPAQPPTDATTNRTGLPMLSEQWDRIFNTPGFTPAAQERAWTLARSKYQAFEADAARAERLDTAHQKQVQENAENSIWADVYSPQPKISAQQVAVDPAFDQNPERRKQMIDLINNPPGSGVPANQSYATALSLLARIRLPEGAEGKITDPGPLYDAATKGQINKSDFEFVKKEFNDVRTPENENVNALKTELLKRYSPFINKSNPLSGQVDPVGDARQYEYDRFISGQLSEYRKAGKDPSALFNPKSPDFLGSPAVLSQFQPTMEQSMNSVQNWASSVIQPLTPIGAPPPPPIPDIPKPEPAPTMRSAMPGAAPIPGGVEFPIPPAGITPRKPGETPAQYMQRIGAQ